MSGFVRGSVLVLLAILVAGASTLEAEEATGRLFAVVKAVDRSLVDLPVMASAVTPAGVVVDQSEVLLVAPPNKASVPLERLAPGVWDVRVEGAGLVTEVKKGVQVFAGRDVTLEFVVRPGQGVHVVEYAVAGLSREEVAARLAALESAVAQLEAAASGG